MSAATAIVKYRSLKDFVADRMAWSPLALLDKNTHTLKYTYLMFKTLKSLDFIPTYFEKNQNSAFCCLKTPVKNSRMSLKQL